MEELIRRVEEVIRSESEKTRVELKTELTRELKTELTRELKTELTRELKTELTTVLDKEIVPKMKTELKTELSEEVKKEILDHMFWFEENYGRKINIMFEELMSKLKKDRNAEENVLILEKRVDKNSAFVFNHENRITTLEMHEDKSI